MSHTGLTDEQLNRYSRHLLLPEIDLNGQQRLSQSKVVVIGAGGLGGPACLYLASSGVGQITIFDYDHVDLGNLQRQIAYSNNDVGKAKASQLKNTLLGLNPEIEVIALNERAEGERLAQAINNADAIIDACDNFDTRFAINEACVASKKPLISGAAIQFQGQVSVFNPNKADSPCYRCLYRDENEPRQTCRDLGVFAPLTGIIGSIQAAETLKVLLGLEQTLVGRLLLFDAKTMTPRTIKIPKDPDCPICSAHHRH